MTDGETARAADLAARATTVLRTLDGLSRYDAETLLEAVRRAVACRTSGVNEPGLQVVGDHAPRLVEEGRRGPLDPLPIWGPQSGELCGLPYVPPICLHAPLAAAGIAEKPWTIRELLNELARPTHS